MIIQIHGHYNRRYHIKRRQVTISSMGTIIMPYSWNSSDERIKTNVKTIEYALD
jgi:hypothetical protein